MTTFFVLKLRDKKNGSGSGMTLTWQCFSNKVTGHLLKQTNNNDLLEKDGGTKNCIYKD